MLARGQTGREPRDPTDTGQPRDARNARPGAKPGVPPEDFVTPQTREHHGEAGVTCRLGYEIGIDAVDRRLVHRLKDLRNFAREVGSAHANVDVLGADATGDALGVVPL